MINVSSFRIFSFLVGLKVGPPCVSILTNTLVHECASTMQEQNFRYTKQTHTKNSMYEIGSIVYIKEKWSKKFISSVFVKLYLVLTKYQLKQRDVDINVCSISYCPNFFLYYLNHGRDCRSKLLHFKSN